MKKYKLLKKDPLAGGKVREDGRFRIEAIKDFGSIKNGDLGGLVAGEHNLSQEGTCWVDDHAIVSGSARVSDSAKVYGSALVSGTAQIFDSASVCGAALVFGDAQVFSHTLICDSAQVFGSAKVFGSALVSGSAQVYNSAAVFGYATVSGSARVYDSAQVYDSSRVLDYARIFGSARLYGAATVHDYVEVTKCLFVQQPRHNITVTNTHVFVGCEGHTWEHWEAEIENIGKNHMYSEQEIQTTRGLLTLLKGQIKGKAK